MTMLAGSLSWWYIISSSFFLLTYLLTLSYFILVLFLKTRLKSANGVVDQWEKNHKYL